MSNEMVFFRLKTSIEENIEKMKKMLDELNKKEEDTLELKEILNFARKDSTKLAYLGTTKMNMLIDNIVSSEKSEEYKKELARAKFLMENAKMKENSSFTQYKDAIKNLDGLYMEISKYYEKIKATQNIEVNKKEIEEIISKYLNFLELFTEEGFIKKVEDLDSFVNILSSISLTDEEENTILKNLFLMTVKD